ncbi:MAG: ABC transporter permease [Saprospiraceae bacterium]|nr:ABC transporter permease [Saprospiraceae bacterium]
MNPIENIKLAIGNVRSNLLRSMLTMMIIAFGVMALVGILTAIDSILNSMTTNFSGLGANSFSIEQKNVGFRGHPDGKRRVPGPPITFEQANELFTKNKLPTKVAISGSGVSGVSVVYENKKTTPEIDVIGINENYLSVNSFNIQAGRPFSSSEFQYGVNVCIVGMAVVKRLFNGRAQAALDRDISIGGNKFRIVGVMESQGSSMTSNVDKQIEIPLLTQKKLYGYADQSYFIGISTPLNMELNAAIDYTTGLFRNIRRLRAGVDNDFEIRQADAIMKILEENSSTLRIATIGIGLITLLGAAIGLMNIMLVSVKERTREIGIRKALGATRNNILSQFLIEAVVICQLGGLLGIVLGILAGNSIALFLKGGFIIPWDWIILGIVVCVVVGLFSGIYPAMKAARLDPVESLRYE